MQGPGVGRERRSASSLQSVDFSNSLPKPSNAFTPLEPQRYVLLQKCAARCYEYGWPQHWSNAEADGAFSVVRVVGT